KASGIPTKGGKPSPCIPNAKTGKCDKPFVDHADVNGGGPHSQTNATADINGGKMDGFVNQATNAQRGCSDPTNPACAATDTPDVMGYHTRSDIPNYWSYADNFVLQDKMFEPNASWSLPEPDCQNDAAVSCAPVRQNATTPGIWNPLPYFDTVRADGELGNIQSVDNFYNAAKAGSLPAVSWIAPSGAVSEHPPGPVSFGQSYVTSLVNAVMNGPDWKSTAIFLAWDDWGGFYDHV